MFITYRVSFTVHLFLIRHPGLDPGSILVWIPVPVRFRDEAPSQE